MTRWNIRVDQREKVSRINSQINSINKFRKESIIKKNQVAEVLQSLQMVIYFVFTLFYLFILFPIMFS